MLKEACPLKTWKPLGAAQDNPKVKHEGNFSEEESMTDDEPHNLHVHVEPHEEENELKFADDTEEASVEGDGLRDEEEEENVEIFNSFCKQQMVVGRIQKWPSSIAHKYERSWSQSIQRKT